MIIRWQPPAAPATTHKWLRAFLPGLVGQLPSAAIELSPAMALEDGSCNLSVPAIVLSRWLKWLKWLSPSHIVPKMAAM